MGFNVEIDLNVIPDHRRWRIGDAKILPIDGHSGMRSHDLSILAIDGAFQFKRQIDVLGDAVNRECAVGYIAITLLFN